LAETAKDTDVQERGALAVVITCKGMIDQGLFKSIQRRSAEAISLGADYLILEISTYGGELQTADDIAKLLIMDLAPQMHTVAYVKTEAISAGALISVSCQDIVMRENTTIGDCAPIIMGGTLEGVDREKVESFTRAAFDRAARANGYPQALLRAMVTMQVEVFRVLNRQTEAYEFFEGIALPTDANAYDLDGKELVDTEDRLLTVDAATALEYGIARAVVPDRQGVLDFLADRDGVTFASSPPRILETNWSEEMVRKINHPAVIGVLTMIALLGLYIEFNSPGLGLPGLVSALAFITIIGSKYLWGLANWVEVAVLLIGIILVLVEILVIPGFGLAGIAGAFCIVGGFFGMLVRNPPDRIPFPQNNVDWNLFTEGLLGFMAGVVGFIGAAILIARYLPGTKLFGGLVLSPATTLDPEASVSGFRVGDTGVTCTPLRPAGRILVADEIIDCVTHGEFLDKGTPITIRKIQGNLVVVEKTEGVS
jgi:membrane-bound serine protease (ClpP class)